MADDAEPVRRSRIIPGSPELQYYPAHNLVAWRPKGILDDDLLDEIGEWLAAVESDSSHFKRFVDFTLLTRVEVRSRHVFAFAQRRAVQVADLAPVNSALFSDEWIAFGIAGLYEELMADTPINVRAFQDRAQAAAWLGVPVDILQLPS